MSRTADSLSISPWRLCVAPMMDWTDRHCRYFHRLIAPRTRLYTEMITTGALLHGDVPRHLDFDAIGRSLAALPGVTDVHDLHIWNMSTEGVALSAHLAISRGEDWPALLAQARRMLANDYGIRHATLQPTWPVPSAAREGSRVIPLRASEDHGQ